MLYLKKKITNDFILINGDTWIESWMKDIISIKSPAIGLVKKKNTSRYGIVNFKNSKVISFKEKCNIPMDG